MASSSTETATPAFEWFPARLLQKKPRSAAKPHAVVVLNQPLTGLEPVQQVWHSAQYRVAADGGANQLHDVREAAGRDYVSHRHETLFTYINSAFSVR